jgi:hypothetical protein
MRTVVLHIIFIVLFTACQSKKVNRPVLLNSSGVISLPEEKIVFTSDHENWNASLLSFTQPIPLQLEYNRDGFSLSLQNKFGVTEGPAQLILCNDDDFFYYDIHLLNSKGGSIADKDYRSPKTVNPDSSLLQQRIVHTIDQWRNTMKPSSSADYFHEEWLTLQPVAGTFRAQKDEPVSAFYVQPGSAVAVPVQAEFNKEEHVFIVTAGPLKDKHKNTVANGTAVAFLYNDGAMNYRMEASVVNGIATITIPSLNKTYTLCAKVNETVSPTIQLISR